MLKLYIIVFIKLLKTGQWPEDCEEFEIAAVYSNIQKRFALGIQQLQNGFSYLSR